MLKHHKSKSSLSCRSRFSGCISFLVIDNHLSTMVTSRSLYLFHPDTHVLRCRSIQPQGGKHYWPTCLIVFEECQGALKLHQGQVVLYVICIRNIRVQDLEQVLGDVIESA